MGPSSLASWALLIATALRERGIDAVDVFRRAGIPSSHLGDPSARYPAAAMRRLWLLAAEATRDPCFGLAVGRTWHPTSFHALGYSALACGTLRDALEYVARYCRVVSTGASVALIDRGDEVMVTLTSTLRDDGMPVGRSLAVQAGLAAIAVLCRVTRGGPVALRRVTFVCAENDGASRLGEFFGCPIEFGATHDALVFPAADLDARVPTGSPALLRISEQALNDYLARADAGELADRVASCIATALPSGNFGEAAIARSLHVSLRSMQRKLRREGTTFRQLLDQTRARHARLYLTDSSLSVSEIAYLLGFSEASSLLRAMRRWGLRRP